MREELASIGVGQAGSASLDWEEVRERACPGVGRAWACPDAVMVRCPGTIASGLLGPHPAPQLSSGP